MKWFQPFRVIGFFSKHFSIFGALYEGLIIRKVLFKMLASELIYDYNGKISNNVWCK